MCIKRLVNTFKVLIDHIEIITFGWRKPPQWYRLHILKKNGRNVCIHVGDFYSNCMSLPTNPQKTDFLFLFHKFDWSYSARFSTIKRIVNNTDYFSFRVEAPLLNLGWKRTNDKYDERFRLKWVECKTRINYGAFKEGDYIQVDMKVYQQH